LTFGLLALDEYVIRSVAELILIFILLILRWPSLLLLLLLLDFGQQISRLFHMMGTCHFWGRRCRRTET